MAYETCNLHAGIHILITNILHLRDNQSYSSLRISNATSNEWATRQAIGEGSQ